MSALWCVQENFCENLCLSNRIMSPQQVAQILSDLILCDKILLRRQRFSRKNSSVRTKRFVARAATCCSDSHPPPTFSPTFPTSQHVKTLTCIYALLSISKIWWVASTSVGLRDVCTVCILVTIMNVVSTFIYI